jgi:hypothetical protein
MDKRILCLRHSDGPQVTDHKLGADQMPSAIIDMAGDP